MGRQCPLQRWREMHWSTTVRVSWPAGASDLAVALDVGTVLARPVRLMRLLPPAHSLLGGGFPATSDRAYLVGAEFCNGRLSSSLGDSG